MLKILLMIAPNDASLSDALVVVRQEEGGGGDAHQFIDYVLRGMFLDFTWEWE